LLAAGGVPVTTRLLSSDELSVAEGAATVLGALCVPLDGKSAAVKAGSIEALLSLVETDQLSIKTVATAALMNITIDIEGKRALAELEEGVQVLIAALDVEDEKLCLNVLQARRSRAAPSSSAARSRSRLSELSGPAEPRIGAVSEPPAELPPTLQLVANLAEYEKAREMLQCVRPRLAELMTHHVAVLQRHAMLAKRQVEFVP
jgi:hypothetical protein